MLEGKKKSLWTSVKKVSNADKIYLTLDLNHADDSIMWHISGEIKKIIINKEKITKAHSIK